MPAVHKHAWSKSSEVKHKVDHKLMQISNLIKCASYVNIQAYQCSLFIHFMPKYAIIIMHKTTTGIFKDSMVLLSL